MFDANKIDDSWVLHYRGVRGAYYKNKHIFLP